MITLPLAEHTSPIDILISFPEPWKNATKILISFESSTLSSLSKAGVSPVFQSFNIGYSKQLTDFTFFLFFLHRHKWNVMEKTVMRWLYLFLLLGTNASIFNTQDQALPFVPPTGHFLWHHTRTQTRSPTVICLSSISSGYSAHAFP